MRRRSVRSIGIAVGLVLLLSLAGCSALGSGGGDSEGCGPGDTNISSVAATNSTAYQQVSFTGEVVTAERPDGRPASVGASYVIDDGTATAYVTVPSNDVDEGDCVTIEGSARANPLDSGAPVFVAPERVSQA